MTNTTEIRRVAVVGTGRMGAAMVGRLCGAGFDVVVYNRTQAKSAAVAEQSWSDGVALTAGGRRQC